MQDYSMIYFHVSAPKILISLFWDFFLVLMRPFFSLKSLYDLPLFWWKLVAAAAKAGANQASIFFTVP